MYSQLCGGDGDGSSDGVSTAMFTCTVHDLTIHNLGGNYATRY